MSVLNPKAISVPGSGGNDGGSSEGIPLSEKGKANGVASLDATGKVPATQLPAISGGGGGDYNFSVQELDLDATAEKTTATMLVTPDVANTIEGSSTVGKITANDQVKGGYLKVIAGEIKLSIDRTQSSNNIFINQTLEPIVAYDAGGMIPPASLIVGYAFLNDVTFIILGTTDAPVQIMLPADELGPVEEVTFVFDKNIIHVRHNGAVISTYTHPSEYGAYWQLMNNIGVPDTFETTFDLSDASADLIYSLPETAKDGDIYHLTSEGVLFGKRLLVGDYITVYGDKSNVTVTRLPKEQLLTTKITLPITYYLQDYSSKELKAYYDTELRAVFVFGLFHLSSFPNENNIVFEVDISQLDLNAPNLNSMDLIVYHVNNIQRLNTVFSRAEKLIRVRVDPNLFGGTGDSYFLLSNLVLQATL
ncbi:hypothetical protein [Acinetobacter colistiniresistens]|uniref:hypothetical protein n=1 Tax=Acinetobacter colistiniresistens TaxID=280145 RepID=UPI0012505AB4|nr:hypothetical protein [Acinetobacter colistiniresistens]